jgi:hypothetical protein
MTGETVNFSGSIRRLLRRKHSKEYFTGERWTTNISEAKTFEDSLQAARTCAECGLREVEIVLRFNDTSADLFCAEMR